MLFMMCCRFSTAGYCIVGHNYKNMYIYICLFGAGDEWRQQICYIYSNTPLQLYVCIVSFLK